MPGKYGTTVDVATTVINNCLKPFLHWVVYGSEVLWLCRRGWSMGIVIMMMCGWRGRSV